MNLSRSSLTIANKHQKQILTSMVCMAILFFAAPVFAQLDADFTADQTNGCQGLVVQFTDKSTGNVKYWTWSFPGGQPSSSSAQNPQVTYQNPGTYDVELEVKDDQSNTDKEVKQGYIQISDCSPTADFTVTNASGCSPLTVTYTDQSTGATTWSWAFPGGYPSSAQTQGPHYVTYSSAGSYSATLVAANQYGQDTEVKYNVVNVTLCYDYGDAPSPYPTTAAQNGARHTYDASIHLGQWVDHETDGLPDSTAMGDDDDGYDDEDGVEWLEELVPNDTTRVQVTASAGGYLKAWIDFNQDGDWADDGEEVCDTQVGAGTNDLRVVVPADAVEGYTFGRFRFSGNNIPSFEGSVIGGEVEDMRVYIENFKFYDYGDAPDNDSLHYQTLLENNGARHTVSDTIYIGEVDFAYDTTPPPDQEGDGQPDSDAQGDDDDGFDDEEGPYFWRYLVPGDTSNVFVSLIGKGTLHGWFDWNQDGDWNDPEEYAIYFENDESRNITTVPVPVPDTALTGPTYARFRYSVDPLLSSYGRGGCGEVEDVHVSVTSDKYDYGDAPDSYGTLEPDGARHVSNKLIHLGYYSDSEPDGIPTVDALGDDNDGRDDENGVVIPDLNPGESASFEIETWGRIWLFYPLLYGWIDFNQDDDFDDEGEKIFDGVATTNGTHTYTCNIPTDAHRGYTYARFRYSDDPSLTDPTGPSNYEGEVEDYRVLIGEMMFDYGDAPYPFRTRLQEDGARHIFDPDVYLGYGVDADEDGSPDSLAAGDSNDNVDDDDGVTFQGAWIPGDTVMAYVTNSVKGCLSVWISYNGDEQIYLVADLEGLPPGHTANFEEPFEIPIPVPVDAPEGPAYLRFRFSTQPVDSADGIAIDGEVEDYRVEIFDDLDFPAEYGDAPEGIMAYPDKGVVGSFPTLEDSGPAGYVRHGTRGEMYLGYSVDYELDGDEGTAAPIGDPWDTDEGLNDRRGDVTIYTDIGLTDPCNFTIRGETGSEYYWPYSVLSARGVLGEPGETVRWGDYDLDGVYHVTAEDGAYFNVLIDWNQDGNWGGDYLWDDGLTSHTTPEHIVQNFYIPQSENLSGYGVLSDLDPPEFVLPDDVAGYVWMRWTISDTTVSTGWDGSGTFGDGETEDYLIAVCYDSLFDYGDAPQGALAYPSTGVIGEFQTAWGIPGTIGGAIWHHKSTSPKWFGNCIDYEWTGNAGLAYVTPWVYDADEDYNNEIIIEELQDAGLRLVMPYKITGMPGLETVEPYVPFESTSLRRSLGGVGETAVWGVNLDMEVSLRTGTYSESYFTLVVDWDQDGLWETSEIVHENILLSHSGSSFDGMLSELGLPNFEIGPNIGYVWARFILSERPVTAWFGEYFSGETEDYLLHVSERSFLYDWGDAPYPFPTNSQDNGARHLFDGNIYLGSSVDTEEEGQGDEKASSDYDDGVTFQGAWIPGDTVTAYVTVSDTGYLSIWSCYGVGAGGKVEVEVDVSRIGEMALNTAAKIPNIDLNKDGKIPMKIPVPKDAQLGTGYIRFRFSTQPVDSVDGIAPDGEVEDYRIEVFDALEIPYEYGDAPENETAYPHLGVTGQFPTFKDEGPAGYVRHGTAGELYLGSLIDYETDGNAGVTPPIGGDYDEDEKHNEVRDFMDVSNDIGLVAPHAYTITEKADTLVYWPYSVYHMPRGSLGDEPGDVVEWGTSGGRHLDIKYSVSSAEGAYINILIDWNQNGQWGDTDEHVLMNFWVPCGTGRLSDQGPPPITVGETEGHTWMRVTLSETTVEENWDGEGSFADGETEDYLICASYDGLYDYGDAPEGALAYPSTGVVGSFPTSVGVTDAGYIRHQHGGNRSFGRIDYEYEGNAGLSPVFTGYYDSDESFYNTGVLAYTLDAGLHGVFPHTIKGAAGSEYVEAFDDGSGLPYSIGGVGQMAAWGTNLDLSTHVNMYAPGGAYVNVLIDWNQDGDWGDVVDYPSRGITVPERVLRNFYISGSGYLSTLGAPDFRIGPNSGYCWMRCTITRMPVEAWGWDGSGDYVDGETEDYLIKVEDYGASFDFGDVPILSYGVLHSDSGAVHTVQSGFCLGDSVDPDPDGWPIPGGYGDDTHGSDDDDGIEFLTPLIPGQTAQIRATVSGSGNLSGWIDFNADSSWDDPGEQIWTDSQVADGSDVVSFTVPSDAVLGVTYARFRFSDTGGLSPNGPAHFSDMPDQSSMPPIGEVEDYAVLICAAGATFDYGDAPDPTYPTLAASSGAYHVIDPNVTLGAQVDDEVDGLQHTQALGDDYDVSDDEDGVQFPSTITSGTAVSASVTLSIQGYLNIWIDLNADGDWFDTDEHVLVDSLLVGGTHSINLSATLVAIPDSLIFARVRFSTFPGVGVMGPASDGEVEDYLLNVVDTGVEDDKADLIPDRYSLKQNYPNPFNPETNIQYQLKTHGRVAITIYNTSGRFVKKLVDEVQPAGAYTVIWDGKDDAGTIVSSGIYFLRMEAKDFVQTRKVLFLK